MPQITTLWKREVLKLKNDSVPTLTYLDFQVEGIDGIFRAVNSKGVEIEKTIERIEENREFFLYLIVNGIKKVFEESETFTNWGNGWEWEERKHSVLHKDYRIEFSNSWFTRPFGSKSPEIKSMFDLYNDKIESSGISLLRSWNCNRQPGMVCYFFPNKQS